MEQELPLQPGYVVETFDRRVLGVIDVVDGDRFLLRPRLRSPFWLADGLVRAVSGDRVLLHIDSRVLPRYRSRDVEGRERSWKLFGGVPAPIASSALVTALAAALWIGL